MEYLFLEINSMPELVLAHYFSCREFDTGFRKLPGIEIMLADKENWHIEIGGKKFVQVPGQLCVLPLSTSHRVSTQAAEGLKSAHFALHFIFSGSCTTLTSEEFKEHVTTLSGKGDATLSLYQNRLFLPLTPQLEEVNYSAPHFKEILKEWTGKEAHSKYCANIILQKLLVDISRSCINKATGDTKTSGRYPKEAVNRAILFISENFGTIKSIQDVADHLNLNSSYLGSIFKAYTGVSLINYINALRVERAKLLLLGPGLSFREIGERVGVNNPYYFSSLFKKYAGMTMSEYSNIILR